MAMLSRRELLKIYDYVGPFREGLASVRKDNKCFHIDPNGEPAYKERYDHVGSFQGGMALVRRGKDCFKIRPDGSRVII